MKDIAVTFDVSINESQLMNVPLIGIDYCKVHVHVGVKYLPYLQ